jgi:putative ABC transport system substrate-binding protein
MRRRDFIAGLGTAAAWPLVAHAQQIRRIGVLIGYEESDNVGQSLVSAFRKGLQELGWVEGRNVRIDYRWGAGDPDRTQLHAAELAGIVPDVIQVDGTTALTAVQRANRNIPIVFASISDPVEQGIVESLVRPGGNVTGFTFFDGSVAAKLLETLKEIAPRMMRVAMLITPDHPAYGVHTRTFEAAASLLAVAPVVAPVRNGAEIERAIEALEGKPNSGLLAPPDRTVIAHRELIVALATRHRLPGAYFDRAFVTRGGLMSYGPDLVDQYRRAASYVDRILKGTKPTDLPVQQPTKFQFVLNLKTAKALGLTIPETLLATADEVIQ